jgi:hypothetical protein
MFDIKRQHSFILVEKETAETYKYKYKNIVYWFVIIIINCMINV